MSQPRYIVAAFRSSTKENEAYLFMKNECVVVNYAPGSKDDRIVHGPLLIGDGFPLILSPALRHSFSLDNLTQSVNVKYA